MRIFAIGLLFALVLATCVPELPAESISFDALHYVGTAYRIPIGARLTDTRSGDAEPPAGAVWLPQAISVSSGFALSFAFRMSEGQGWPDPDGPPVGADGLAFVIQNSPDGLEALGRGAGGLGYMYIPNSLAVEFDTYQNAWWYGDPDGNHVSVNTRGTDPNVPHHVAFPSGDSGSWLYEEWGPWIPCARDPSLITVPVERKFNDGEIQHAQIVYRPGNLMMYLNDTPDPLFSLDVDLTRLLALQNGTHAYLGFTAGTMYGYQYHDIVSIHLVPEPAGWMLVSGGLLALLVCTRKKWRA